LIVAWDVTLPVREKVTTQKHRDTRYGIRRLLGKVKLQSNKIIFGPGLRAFHRVLVCNLYPSQFSEIICIKRGREDAVFNLDSAGWRYLYVIFLIAWKSKSTFDSKLL